MMVRHHAELNQSIALVKERCTEEDFLEYRRRAGKLMGYLGYYGMDPIFKEHPELVPPDFQDSVE